MATRVFEISSAIEVGPSQWELIGHAFEVIKIGDKLTVFPENAGHLRVRDIVVADRHASAISCDMMGTVYVEGAVPLGDMEPESLFRSDRD